MLIPRDAGGAIRVSEVLGMRPIGIMTAAAFMNLGAMAAMTTEEASSRVLDADGAFEVRVYAPHIVAETLDEGSLEEAGNEAFGRLFRYISGGSRSREKVAATAPVSRQPRGERIAMTAPVSQQRAQGQWAVSFVMPASYAQETLPAPEDPRVTLRQVPARTMAAARYSGSWSEKGYPRHRDELESWIRAKGLTIAGDPVRARYNSPFSRWFLRRNEILIPVANDTNQAQARWSPSELPAASMARQR